MSSDSNYRTTRFPSTSWYCPSETQERSLAAALENFPLPYTIGQVVAFVKAEMSDERPDEYKPAFFEAKVLADRDNLSPEEQRVVRALQASKGKFANPITEIEKGVALSLLCKSDRVKPVANLYVEIQECCQRAIDGVQFLIDRKKQYTVDRQIGGGLRHQPHNQAKAMFVSLLEASTPKLLESKRSVVVRALLEPLRDRLRLAGNPLAEAERLEATLIRWLSTDSLVKAAYRGKGKGDSRRKKLVRKEAPPAARAARIEDHFFGGASGEHACRLTSPMVLSARHQDESSARP